jgi:hypothetical protein
MTISLVTHGLGALSVESKTIGVRMLVASLVLIGCLVLALLATVAIRLGMGLAIPGWATTAAGLLLILLAQTLMLTVLFSFITLAGRLGMQFLPCRDCAFFVEASSLLRHYFRKRRGDRQAPFGGQRCGIACGAGRVRDNVDCQI